VGKAAFNGHDNFGCPRILQTSHTNLAAISGHPSILPNPMALLPNPPVCVLLLGVCEKSALRLITLRFRMCKSKSVIFHMHYQQLPTPNSWDWQYILSR